MQSFNFATFWVEQWLKFLTAAGAWPSIDRDSLNAQLAELRAGAERVELELKSVADERSTLRRDLAAAQQVAKAATESLAGAESELTKLREDAAAESRQLTEEISRMQRQIAAAETSAKAERSAVESARDAFARERDKLAAELDRVRKAADADRQRLEAAIGELQSAGGAVAPAPPTAASGRSTLQVHFRKPADWGEPFVHYWNSQRRTTWPGEQMSAEGDGWYGHSLAEGATVVFNDNSGHQSPDLERQRGGWYDGEWHDEKPGTPARRKARKKESA